MLVLFVLHSFALYNAAVLDFIFIFIYSKVFNYFRATLTKIYRGEN